MANFIGFGKNLPRHEMMRNLLTDLNESHYTESRNSLRKIRYRNRSTQTEDFFGNCDLDLFPLKEEIWCNCVKSSKIPNDRGDVKGNFVKAQVEKFDSKNKSFRYNPTYQTQNFVNLMANIRQRLDKQVECSSNYGSDWSDSNSFDDSVRFPKETKNAMSLLLEERSKMRKTRCNFTPPGGVWSGVAERVGDPLMFCRSGQR